MASEHINSFIINEMSPDLRVMVRPVETYEELRIAAAARSWVDVAGRLALVAAVLATSTAIWTTGHVTLRLVFSLAACWSLAIAVQLAAAVVLIRPARQGLTLPTALDLFFVAHGPWSLWLMASAIWVLLSSPIGRPAQGHALTALIPAIWTAVLVFVFCRVVLDCDSREALQRTALHQAIIWTVTVLLIAYAVQLWPRVLAWLA
jgi:hypothetical protein